MSAWWQEHLVECLGWALVHSLWEGFAVAALLAIVLRGLREAGSNTRYVAGCAALLLMATAPVMTFQQVAAHYRLEENSGVDISRAAISSTAATEIKSWPAKDFKFNWPAHKLNFRQRLELFLPWLVAAWFAGVLIFSLRLFIGWMQITRLRRKAVTALANAWQSKLAELELRVGIRRAVRLWQSALVEVPTVIGWLRPIILMPASCLAGLTPEQLESILAHELAHIRRHDYLVNLLQTMVETILFYHPAMWWVSRQIRAERENCCDDLAVAICGDRVNYARALATLEELRQTPGQLSLAAGGAPLLQRIQRLLGRPARTASGPAWPVAGIIIVLLVGAVVMGVRGNRAVAEESKPEASVPVGTGSISAMSVPSGVSTNAKAHDSRAEIFSRLDHTVISSVHYDHLPLTKVMDSLAEITRSSDPNHLGIYFIIDNSDVVIPQGIDPVTGSPMADLGSVMVTLPEMKDIKLADLLDAIVKNASRPIRYSVLDYAVDFEPASKFKTISYRVNRSNFQQEVETVTGISFDDGQETNANATRDPRIDGGTLHWEQMQQAVRKFLAMSGVDLNTNDPANAGKAFVYNSRKGILMVRGTTNDLDSVESAIMKYGWSANDASTNSAVVMTRAKAWMVTTNQPAASFTVVTNGTAPIAYQWVFNGDATNTQGASNVTKTVPRTGDRLQSILKYAEPEGGAGNHSTLTTRLDRIVDNVVPEINIKVKVIELDESRLSKKDLAMIWSGLTTSSSPSGELPRNPVVPSATNSIQSQSSAQISNEEFRERWAAIRNLPGVDEMAAPEVTTENGRQAQIQVTSPVTVVTGVTRDETNHSVHYTTEQKNFGTTVDVIPIATNDNKSIHLTLIQSTATFLGYGSTNVLEPGLGQSPSYQKPLPQYGLRQLSTDAFVADGQTLVIGGRDSGEVQTVKERVPILGSIPGLGRVFRKTRTMEVKKDIIIFVIPTLINADGTRWNKD